MASLIVSARRRGKSFLRATSSLVLVTCAANAQDTGHHHATVGTLHFQVTSNAAAAREFDRGVALLHNFEYVDAVAAFRRAERRDSTLALAWYGEALTFRHPLWREEQLDSARAALARLAPNRDARLARLPSERERSYAAAVEALFANEPEPVRTRAFADSMRAVVVRYPSDDEAKAFASIAMLGAAVFIRDSTGQRMRLEAAALAERVLAANPDHPGAAHYVIHAYDSPSLASHGLDAALRYAAIAPSSGHALHMPSHIFLQLGRWKDVERANVASNASSQKWVRAHKLGAGARDFHSLDWLAYALVQQGRLREARAVIDTAARLVHEGRTFTTADAEATDLGEIFAMYLAWDGDVPLALSAPRPKGFAAFVAMPAATTASAPFFAFYSRALDRAFHGDSTSARDDAKAMRAFTDTNKAGAVRYYRSMGMELDALAMAARGDTIGAIGLLRETVAFSSKLPIWTGPYWGVPAGELLGKLLLASGRNAEAVDAYSQALAMRHNASAPMLGRARALWNVGDRVAAGQAYCEVASKWSAADPDLPALKEVRSRATCAKRMK